MNKHEKAVRLKGTQKGGKAARFRRYFKSHKLLYLMVVPMVAYLLLFNYYPMLGLQMAFKDWNPWKGMWGSPWASTDGSLDLFKNFRTLFESPHFWQKFGNTIRISLLKIAAGFPLPILLTLLMNELTSLRFKKLFQTVSYLPHFISWVIIGGILLSMTAADSGFQLFLQSIFGKQIFFFTYDNSFLAMVVISEVWKNVGWSMIIYVAALTSVPAEQYESAMLDGAGRFARIWHITIPSIMPAIAIRFIFTMSSVNSAGFDQIFNLYNTTVYGKGDILETYLYRNGVISGQYALSTAMGLFNSLISLVLTLTANLSVKKMGGEGIW